MDNNYFKCMPYNYLMFFPFCPDLPDDNDKPPTIYAILNSILNFNKPKEEQVPIKELAEKGHQYIFDFDYPLTNKINRNEFETLILNHFLTRRIGYDTLTAFQIRLNAKMNEIMHNYNMMFNAIDGWDLFNDGELTTRTNTTDSTSNSSLTTSTNTSANNISDRRYSNTPQNHLENVRDGSYVTEYNYDNDNSTGNSKTDSSNKNSSNDKTDETIKRTPADKVLTMKNFLESRQNVYSLLFQDLESLFYQIV